MREYVKAELFYICPYTVIIKVLIVITAFVTFLIGSRHPSTTEDESGSNTSYSNSFGVLKNIEEMVKKFKTKALLLEHEQEVLLSSLMAFKDQGIVVNIILNILI